MTKNKKIVIVVAVELAVIIVGCVIFFVVNNNNNSQVNGDELQNSKLSKLDNKLQNSDKYTFSMVVDNDNKLTYAKSGEMAYSDLFYKGDESKFVTKEGNSYLLKDLEKIYYKYQNNTDDLTKIVDKIANINSANFTTGTEKIGNKNYKYEEYEGSNEFVIKNSVDSTNVTKIRFYFENDNLTFIKTIMEDKEELSEVKISYSVDDNLFEIPSEYKEQ